MFKLEEQFQEELFEDVTKKELTKKIFEISKKHPYRYFSDTTKPIPLWLIKSIVMVTPYSYDEIEKKVEWFGSYVVSGKIYPQLHNTRKLPLIHDEFFDFIAGLSDISVKRGTYQIQVRESNASYIYSIAQRVFGKIETSTVRAGNNTYTTFPSLVYRIINHCHPLQTLDEEIQNIVAYLLGVFTGKGSVSKNGLLIYKKHEELLNHISKLFKIVGCETTLYHGKTQYVLRLGLESSRKFVRLVEETLPEELHFIPYHEELIQKEILRERTFPSPSQVEEMIMRTLQKGPKTVREIAWETGIDYDAILRRVKSMKKRGIVVECGKRTTKRKPSIVYRLVITS